MKWIFVFCLALFLFFLFFTIPLRKLITLFLFQILALSFSSAFWDGFSNLSSMLLNYFSKVSLLCCALSKTVNRLHFIFFTIIFFSQPETYCISLHLRKHLSSLLHLTFYLLFCVFLYFLETMKGMFSKDVLFLVVNCFSKVWFFSAF